MPLFIALVQAAPLFIIGHFAKSKAAITATLVVMLIVAGATGSASYFALDAIVLVIAYFVAVGMITPSEKPKKEDVPNSDVPPRATGGARAVVLGGIEATAENIMKEEGRSQVDAEFLAICTFLDDMQTRPNGQEGARLIVDIARNEYCQHFNDVLMYLGWRDGKLFLKPEFDQRLKERLNK